MRIFALAFLYLRLKAGSNRLRAAAAGGENINRRHGGGTEERGEDRNSLSSGSILAAAARGTSWKSPFNGFYCSSETWPEERRGGRGKGTNGAGCSFGILPAHVGLIQRRRHSSYGLPNEIRRPAPHKKAKMSKVRTLLAAHDFAALSASHLQTRFQSLSPLPSFLPSLFASPLARSLARPPPLYDSDDRATETPPSSVYSSTRK